MGNRAFSVLWVCGIDRRMSAKRGKLRIGTSGYHCDHWKEVFYPRNLRKQNWFAYYARRFDTVEINNTFYHLPQAHSFDVWREQAPPNSCYALKFSRYGSHLKRLQEPHASIAKFLDRASRLRECLGPILVQLPPHWTPDPARLAGFLKAAPSAYRTAYATQINQYLADGLVVFAYFNNDAHGYAVQNAADLRCYIRGD